MQSYNKDAIKIFVREIPHESLAYSNQIAVLVSVCMVKMLSESNQLGKTMEFH